MPYCENCGAPVSENANFCRNCGAKQNTQPQPQQSTNKKTVPIYNVPSQLQTPSEAPEQIYSFLIAYRHKRFGGEEYFTAVLTNRRIIFAPMNKDMLNEVKNISRQQAKGKMPPMNIYPYQQNYLSMDPQTILSQTPGSFAVENSSIKQIKLDMVSTGGDGYVDSWEFDLQILTDSGSHGFHMTKRDEYAARLIQVYQDKVVLPKNYQLP